jgi:hypothetical protein
MMIGELIVNEKLIVSVPKYFPRELCGFEEKEEGGFSVCSSIVEFVCFLTRMGNYKQIEIKILRPFIVLSNGEEILRWEDSAGYCYKNVCDPTILRNELFVLAYKDIVEDKEEYVRNLLCKY